MGEAVRAGVVQASSEALVNCVSRIYARGWCDGTSGNYSVTLRRHPLRLLITRGQIDKGLIRASDLLVIGRRGRPRDGTSGNPSAEAMLHVAIAGCTDACAILHTHSVWNTLLGEHFREAGGFEISGYEMLKGINGFSSHREKLHVPVVENSQQMPELADQVSRLLRGRRELQGFLIAGHGLYTWGRSIEEAYRHVEIFEFLFRLAGSRVGFEPLGD